MADIFLLFTILALIIAIVQILPKTDVIQIQSFMTRRLKFSLFLLGMLIIILMAGSVYLEYSDTLTERSTSINQQQSNQSIIEEPENQPTNSNLSSTSLNFYSQMASLLILVAFIYIYSFRNKRVNDTTGFIEALDELHLQGIYSPFFKLFESNYDFLLMVPPVKIIPTTRRGRIKQRFRDTYDRILTFFPREKERKLKTHEEVLSFVRGKFSDSNFVEKLALIKPGLGVRISFDDRVDRDLRRLLIFEFYRVLLKNPNSVLHREICESMELRLDDRHRYKIPQDSQIISAIFANLAQIQDLDIIKAFGETTIELIRAHYEKQRGQQRLAGVDTFSDREVNPIITGFRFFDLIVTEALYQKIRKHMWLYYYIHFVRAICDQFPNLDPDEYYHTNDLPEIRYLHEIIFTLIRWIEIADDDPDKIELQAANDSCADDNGSIIKSSIICLSQCIDAIIRSKKIPDLVKVQLVRGYLEKSLELRGSKKPVSKSLGCAMAKCFLQQGNIDRDSDMKQTLHSFIKQVDTGKLLHNSDGKQLYHWLLQKTTLKLHRRRSTPTKKPWSAQQ